MSKIPLPKDHEGREIPLDTLVLYDANGKEVSITSFTFRCSSYGHWSNWKVFSPDARGEEGMLPVNGLYLTPPDSWEKLLEDLNEGGTIPSTRPASTSGRPSAKACPRCGAEPKVEDVRECSLTKPNVMSVTCPACGMSNSIA